MSPRTGMGRARPRAVLLDFDGTVVAEDDIPLGQACQQIADVSVCLVSNIDNAELHSALAHVGRSCFRAETVAGRSFG